MNTYLKYKPVWYRIVILGSLIVGSSMAFGLLSLYIVSNMTGIPFAEVQLLDFTDPDLRDAQRVLLFVNSLAVFLVPALLYSYFADPQPMRFLRLDVKPKWWHWVVGGVIVIAAMPSAFWLGELNKQLDVSQLLPSLDKWMRESEASSNKVVESILLNQTPQDLAVNLFLMALLPAVCEEVFFRGLIQKGIMRTTRNVWFSIIISGVIFSAFHFQFLTFLTRLEMGIILGALYWYTGSLWVPILAHLVFNGMQVIMAYYNPEMINTPPDVMSAGWAGLSFLTVAALIFISRKMSVSSLYEVFDDEDDFTVGPKDEYLQ